MPGRVLIQTRSPDHPAVVAAQTHDVRGFIEHELVVRKEVGYPPYTHIALIRLDGLNESEVASEAARVALLAEEEGSNVEVLGPAPAPLARLRNEHRFQVLLKGHRPTMREAVREALVEVFGGHRWPKVAVDVDPLSVM